MQLLEDVILVFLQLTNNSRFRIIQKHIYPQLNILPVLWKEKQPKLRNSTWRLRANLAELTSYSAKTMLFVE